MPDPTFINYSHPSEQSNRQNRRMVASYIGTHYRNRSKPSARKALQLNDPTSSWGGRATSEDRDSSNNNAIALPFRKRNPEQRSQQPSQCQSECFPLPAVTHDKHGFRSDPFNAYPIEFRACLPAAIDFFLGFYGPAHVIRPEVLSAQTGTIILQQYFQYAVQNSLMFEAIIALSQANLTIQNWVSNGPDRDALYHYSRAVHRLRELLAEQHGYTQDSVLFAIVALMGVDVYLLNDLAAFEMHLGGLRRIVSLRGGLNQLGWPKILKPYLIGLEGFWAYLSKHQTNVSDSQQAELALPGAAEDLDLTCPYNREPIAELGELIAALPPGFRNLALNYRLSVPVMTLIHRVTTKAHFINQVVELNGSTEVNATNLQEAEYCVRLLACTDLTIIERACCIGALVAIVDCTRSERFSPLYVQQIRHHSAELLLWQARFADTDLAEYFLWVGLDIVGTMFPPRITCLPANYRNDKRFELLMAIVQKYGHLEWDEVSTITKKFFSTGPCLQSWENAWRFGKAEVEKQRKSESPGSES